MNFITLTKATSGVLLVNPVMIVALEPVVSTDKTNVHTMAQSWMVSESVEQIKKKIAAESNYRGINYDPPKRK